MPTFAARRSYRPNALIAGLIWLLACAAAAIGANGAAPWLVPWLAGAGAIGFMAGALVARIPQRATLVVSATEIAPSWRAPVRVARVRLGRWVVPGVDAAHGVVLHAGGLRIGADGHAGDGYDLGGPAARVVDCHVDRSEFDALAGALGVARGAPGPLVVPLVRSSRSLAGVLRTLAPWLATMAACGLVGALASTFELDPGALAIATATIVIAGLVAMVAGTRRVRPPGLELRVEPEELVLARPGGDAVARTAWRDVLAACRHHTVSSRIGSHAMPVLELQLGDHRLRLGAWDTRLAWPGEPATTWRGPAWLVGAAQWPRLVDELRRHGRL